jgi:nucleotide-binding universal stress UspA family protein
MSTQSGSGGKPVRKILTATDFSPTSAAAVEWSTLLAKTHGAAVVLVHALAPPIPPAASPDFVALPPDFQDQYRTAATKNLAETAERVRARGVAISTDLELGPAAPTILDLATKHAADLIVVGTHGLTGFRHLLLGSTAERIVQGAPVPVLIVHPGDVDKHRHFKTVLVPTDFSADAALAIGEAHRVLHAAEDGARLILLHAYHLPVEFTALGTVPVTPRLFADAAEQAREQLERLAAPLRRDGLRVDTLAREGYPPTVIEEEARHAGADLIAMGTHGRSGLRHFLLGSTAERVVQHAPCPVLTVRRTA